MTTPDRAARPLARFGDSLGRYTTATVTALQLLVGVLAGGSVVGSFVVPGGDDAAGPPQYTAIGPGAPIRLSMPKLKVTAPVVPITMADKALDPPRDYHEVGWWVSSARPGDLGGQTVITGHTVHTGGASMNHLGRLHAGDLVDVISKRGTMRYIVGRTKVYSKAQLAEHAQELFGQDHGRGRLVLITCTDWDGVEYESNVVVLAKPLGAPADRS
ncbi:LPXTG-site transpeptidase (sortase) family protein [Nocardioides terrae]|uniref:LPXTG-site transpeptidase (Sortase) family protein n=2 Tax=Nocardioides terrae TaxID=574651 RepID=A0A1I1MPB1_9ACTN|nr:LPXTG-site transpeptidase (sortase) family protein [Nocardioides terrae]